MRTYNLGLGWTATFAEGADDPVLTLQGPDKTDRIVLILDKDEMIRLRDVFNATPALNAH